MGIEYSDDCTCVCEAYIGVRIFTLRDCTRQQTPMDLSNLTIHTYLESYVRSYCCNIQCDLCNQSGILHVCVKVCGLHGAIEVVWFPLRIIHIRTAV